MREIAYSAECSLRMLYYYYKQKAVLFFEIAVNEFFTLINRLDSEVIPGAPACETMVKAIRQRMSLNARDKAAYRLSMKVWLGFEGESPARATLVGWKLDRTRRMHKSLKKTLSAGSDITVKTIVLARVLESMIEKTILLDETYQDEGTRREIEYSCISQRADDRANGAVTMEEEAT